MRWTASKSKTSKRSSVKTVDVSKPASIKFEWTYLNARPEEPECRYSVNLEGMTQIVSQIFFVGGAPNGTNGGSIVAEDPLSAAFI